MFTLNIIRITRVNICGGPFRTMINQKSRKDNHHKIHLGDEAPIRENLECGELGACIVIFRLGTDTPTTEDDAIANI